MKYRSLGKDDKSKVKSSGLYLAFLLIISIGLISWMWTMKFAGEPTYSESAIFYPEFQDILDKQPIVSRDYVLASLAIQNGGLTMEDSTELIDAIEDERLKLFVLKEVLISQYSDHNAYQLGISYGLDGNQIDILRNRYRDRVHQR